jgi:cation diffusion facilitator CzcD-associated flavoprotein CzcO
LFILTDTIPSYRVFDERKSKDAAYPSVLPSVGDSPEYERSRTKRKDSKSGSPVNEELTEWESASVEFAPPGPCYEGLKNNVSTHEMEMQCVSPKWLVFVTSEDFTDLCSQQQAWKPGTQEFVSQSVIADYVQSAAISNDITNSVFLNTRVESVEKHGEGWRVETSTLDKTPLGPHYSRATHYFDAVVAANGHYHATNIPDIAGLKEWKAAFPDRVQHSKLYRRASSFKDQNVLIIGAGVSSTDMARELGVVAKTVYQSSRGGAYDLSSHLLPDNAARVAGIRSFEPLTSTTTQNPQDAIPATVLLTDGTKLCNIHRVILATGYHSSLPFLRTLHADNLTSAKADDRILITDGLQTHNLHKDIFYIPDPTLAFVGIPFHTATFSFFEFQAVALAAVLSGRVSLPSEESMRAEYLERLKRKGAGRPFHSMRGEGQEIGYVKELVAWVNGKLSANEVGDGELMQGHSKKWFDSYARRLLRMEALFKAKRDPEVDRAVLGAQLPCT